MSSCANVENWESFEDLIIRHHPQFSDEWRIISYAYILAKAAHAGQLRGDGHTRYFEHPRSVAVMAMGRYGIYEPAIIAGLLLHDTPEECNIPFPKVQYRRNDVDGGNIMHPYSTWRRESYVFLFRLVGADAAQLALDLTRPHVEGIEFTSESQTREAYLAQLRQAGPRTVVCKMLDNLGNLESLAHLDPAKQRKQVDKSRDKYRPIFETALGSPQYGEVATVLLSDIDTAIGVAVATWR